MKATDYMSHASSGLRLVLGSASPGRLKVLREAGLEPIVRVSDVDEDAILAAARAQGGLSPADEVLLLAEHKARDVAARILAESGDGPLPGDFVLGCDSMLEIGGRVVGKPGKPEIAIDRWKAMRGGRGILHTGHYLIDLRTPPTINSTAVDQNFTHAKNTCSTTIFFANPSDDDIYRYVATEEPLHVAGAFTLDGFGAAFVTGVDGDHASVIGVSPSVLNALLGEFGVSITQLWAQ